MKIVIFFTQIVSLVFIAGCSSKGDSINRLLYETGQGYDRQQCLQNPTADCKRGKSYDQYQRERKDILKAENKVNIVTPETQKLHTCPYSGEPINWVLRYCAIEYQTDDEIFLQKTPCFEKALADLHSKAGACQIKEKYKRHYCKTAVEKFRIRESVVLCMEDHSIKPFFAGN